MRRVLLFDLYWGGHHAQYVEHLVEYQRSRGIAAEIVAAVTPQLLDDAPTLSRASDVSVYVLDDVEAPDPGRLGAVKSDLEHGRRLRSLVDRYRPDRCLLMYFDHVQLSLALGLRFEIPISIAGIYFRPAFHYADAFGAPRSWTQHIRDAQKKAVLRRALRNPHVDMLFSLDPFAASEINAWDAGVRAVPLPDGAAMNSPSEDPSLHRRSWGVESDRSVALMFGVIDARKGVFEVLSALPRLSRPVQERLCIALIGPQSDPDAVREAVRRVRDATSVQIVEDDRFVPHEQVQTVVDASDVVLLPYRHHVGSSNVLVRAAAAGKPVIGPTFGLVGEYIRRNHLGMDVNTSDEQAIADALNQWMQNGLPRFSPEAADAFAREHSAENYAKTIWSELGFDPDSGGTQRPEEIPSRT